MIGFLRGMAEFYVMLFDLDRYRKAPPAPVPGYWTDGTD